MKSTLWWLGLIFGTLSVVMLIKDGFGYEFAASLEMVLDGYEQAMQLLFGWAQPILERLLSNVAGWLGWSDFSLYQHWKHVWLLIGIYCFQDARTYLTTGNRVSAYFHYVLGFLVAVGSACGAGSVQLMSGDATDNFFIAAIPILGIACYEIFSDVWMVTFWPRKPGRAWAAALAKRLFEDTLVVAAALAFTAFFVAQASVSTSWSSGLLALAAVVIALAFFEVGIAVRRVLRTPGQHSWATFLRQGNTQVAMARLAVFAGAAVFLLVNAGLQQS